MKLDRDRIRAAILAGLPGQAGWEVMDHFPIDYDFTLAQTGLHEPTTDMIGYKQWSHLLIFGSIDCGTRVSFWWIGIDKNNGAIYELDEDGKGPMVLLNSSIEEFIRTFNLLNEYLGKKKPLPADIARRVEEIDPRAYSESKWRSFVEFKLGDQE